MRYVNRSTLSLLGGMIVLLIIGAKLLGLMSMTPDPNANHQVTSVIGGSFTLVGTNGQTVTPASWPGKLLVIAFGYRFCPDVCPTNLGTIASALDRLGTDAMRIQPLFITIDPERDSVDSLRDYVSLFYPRLIGLTGTPDQIAAAAKTFRIYYRKIPGATPETYSMDHSAFFFVADDHGTVIKVFDHDITVEALAKGLKSALAHL